MNKFTSFFARWQESILWLPTLVLLALAAWLVLGALDRTATVDTLSLVINLPVLTAYALAALALTHLARRRWRKKLADHEQDQWWTKLMRGDHGAVVIYIVDAAFTVILTCALLAFFFFSL
jgi:amino acid transporter